MINRIDNGVLAPPGPPPQPAPRESSTDSSKLSAMYANFARLTGTPEELVLDFGLNTPLNSKPDEPMRLTRLVLGYYTAKRLLEALHWAVQQHENTYGVLETDVQKRAQQLAY